MSCHYHRSQIIWIPQRHPRPWKQRHWRNPLRRWNPLDPSLKYLTSMDFQKSIWCWISSNDWKIMSKGSTLILILLNAKSVKKPSPQKECWGDMFKIMQEAKLIISTWKFISVINVTPIIHEMVKWKSIKRWSIQTSPSFQCKSWWYFFKALY